MLSQTQEQQVGRKGRGESRTGSTLAELGAQRGGVSGAVVAWTPPTKNPGLMRHWN